MERAPADAERRDPVPAVSRAVAILDVLAAAEGTRLSVGEISRSLGLPKSSTANLCAALEDADLVSRRGGGYRLGRKLVELGGRYLSTVDHVQEFYDACARTQHLSAETVRLAVLDGTDVLDLARYLGTQPIRLTTGIGDRLPAITSAAGVALLSTLDSVVVADRLRRQTVLPAAPNRPPKTLADFLCVLDQTRKRGYAVDDEDTMPGVVGFAVPVEDSGYGEQAFAVSVTLLKARLNDDLETQLVEELHDVAKHLTNPMTPPRS